MLSLLLRKRLLQFLFCLCTACKYAFFFTWVHLVKQLDFAYCTKTNYVYICKKQIEGGVAEVYLFFIYLGEFDLRYLMSLWQHSWHVGPSILRWRFIHCDNWRWLKRGVLNMSKYLLMTEGGLKDPAKYMLDQESIELVVIIIIITSYNIKLNFL